MVNVKHFFQLVWRMMIKDCRSSLFKAILFMLAFCTVVLFITFLTIKIIVETYLYLFVPEPKSIDLILFIVCSLIVLLYFVYATALAGRIMQSPEFKKLTGDRSSDGALAKKD